MSETTSVFHSRQHSLPIQENAGINPLFYPRKVCLQLDDIQVWNDPILLNDIQAATLNPNHVNIIPMSATDMNIADMNTTDMSTTGMSTTDMNTTITAIADTTTTTTSAPTNTISIHTTKAIPFKPILASQDQVISRKGVSLSKSAINSSLLFCPAYNCSISRVAFCYRDERQIRHATPYDGKVKFDLTYHGLLFDVIKVNLLKKGFESHGKFAQAVIKLSLLKTYKDGAHVINFPLVDYRKKQSQIGVVSILLQFYDFVSFDFSLIFGPTTSEPEEMTQQSRSTSSNSSLSSSNCAIASDDTDNQTEYFSATSSTADSTRDTSTDISDSLSSWKGDAELIQAFRSLSVSTIQYEKIQSSSKPGFSGIKSLAAGLLATGWNLSSTDLVRALSLLGRYSRAYPTPKTGDCVIDPTHLKEADHFLTKFIMPIYGTVARKFFGYGSPADVVKRNKTVAIEHLGIKKNHMLAWEYTPSKLFASKPSFYICFTPDRKSIQVCVRGTYNIQDIFTDMNCEFAPFMGGTAHKGILQSALWIRDHYYEKIKNWIREMNATFLYLCGHSLGGSISSVLLMLIYHDIVKEFPSLVCKVYAFAPAPCVSDNLVAAFEPFIESFINKHDPVPTLSYGSVMDLKEMLVYASRITRNSKLSKDQQLEKLFDFANELRRTNKHPRLLIAGQILFMYKTSDSSTFFEKPTLFSKKKWKKNPVEYRVERSIPEFFDHLHLKSDMLYYHFPSMYQNSLRKAILELEKE